MTTHRTLLTVVSLAVLVFVMRPLSAEDRYSSVASVIRDHCLDCHAGEHAEAGLDLQSLRVEMAGPADFRHWMRVHDRVAAGEMPPADAGSIHEEAKKQFVEQLAAGLRIADLQRQADGGRTGSRRLNRTEFEYTLRDLLGLPDLDVREMLPEDSGGRFDTIGDSLQVSYVQMARYLEAADEALRRAMLLGPRPETTSTRLSAIDNGRWGQVARGGREAVAIGAAVGVLRQPNTAQAPWWWSKYNPPIEGEYRLRMNTFGFVWDRGKVLPADRDHVITLQALNGSTKRPLGSFDVSSNPDEPSVVELTASLRPGDQIEVWVETLDDRNKPGELEMDEYTAPGLAVEWLEIEGPLIDQWPPRSYRRLFGDLTVEPWTEESGLMRPPLPLETVGVGKRAQRRTAKANRVDFYHVAPRDPIAVARRLLTAFADAAFRRPVEAEEISDYLELVTERLQAGQTFQESMRIGYQAILCCPEFLFLQEPEADEEPPVRISDEALAARLSYFLWKSMPDERLRSLAAEGRLSQPDVLRYEVERMLDDPKISRFIEDFCGQWLDLRKLSVTQPDMQLYPEFDSLLLAAMSAETLAYFTEMLRGDLGARHLVAGDFVMINQRLAELYEIPGVRGVSVQKVSLPADSPRGGLLTQASVLKVTANGTTTSPVPRGAWVLERLLGQPIPPPPANVPAVEPDLRGMTTIREQLQVHRADPACATCHNKMDPPGFALESFDVIGGFRQRYRTLDHGDPVDKTFKNNRPVRYRAGPEVDSSGVTAASQSFADIHEFRRLLVRDEAQLARNLAEQLLVYATGAEVSFSDRDVVETILQRSEGSQYGLRTLIHEVIGCELFRRK